MTPFRPLITIRSPLGVIPREWLRLIEPRISRPDYTTCWTWNDACDKNGEPVFSVENLETGKRNTVRVKRVVAKMFWPISNHHDVVHLCGTMTCLYPEHFYISSAHWTQEDRAKMIAAKKRYIADYSVNEKITLAL